MIKMSEDEEVGSKIMADGLYAIFQHFRKEHKGEPEAEALAQHLKDIADIVDADSDLGDELLSCFFDFMEVLLDTCGGDESD